MKISGISIFMILLAGALVSPIGFSYAVDSDQTNSSVNATANGNLTFNQFSNQTTNLGQQISDFVHQAIILFKQQRQETVDAIKSCRENIKNAGSENRTQVQENCKSTLQTIREKYQDERNQYHDLFVTYKDQVKVLTKEAKGLEVMKEDKAKLLKQINEKNATGISKNGISEKIKGMIEKMKQKMNEKRGAMHGMATRNNTNCINPPGGPKIC